MNLQIVFATPGLLTDSKSREGQKARQIIGKCTKVVGKARLERGAIVFTIDGAFDKQSPTGKNAVALEALMNCLTDLDSLYLYYKPRTMVLYDTPVYYERTTVWDTIPALYGRGYGDCKSLAACRVAELRRLGVECRPVFRFDSNDDMTMFHILILRFDWLARGLENPFEDPSKIKGMVGPQELATG